MKEVISGPVCARGSATDAATEGVARERAAGGPAGGRAAPRRRWVPPSALRHIDADADAKHDAIHRKVRGILNKLTPEKFHKLSDDLLALELDSEKVLRGVILLIFEKALDEPKYSSMYAQLCKRLSEEAPNFEPPGQPCTFKLLLLNKCRTEFENRAQAFAAFDDSQQLSPEDEERRHLAKCKMLGNIKFIGELGKLEILSESILHRCIQNLLSRRTGGEAVEDLECLAQLVRTCGRVLDSERGRGLMEQYFARVEQLAGARSLPPRIRFMLRDVCELRRGGWVPRAATAGEGPVPMQQLRPPDEPRPRPERELFRRPRPLDDMLAGLALASPLPAPPSASDKLFGNGYGRRGAGYGYGRDAARFGKSAAAGKEQPRLNKQRLAASPALEDVQMRPAANSLLFTANRLSKPAQPPPLNTHATHTAHQPTVLAPAFASSPPLVKEPAITIKPAADKKDKPKKDKGPSKEEVCRVALEAARAVAAAGAGAEGAAAAEAALRPLSELQAPDKLARRAVAALLDAALADTEPLPGAAAAAAVLALRRSGAAEAARALCAAGAGAGGLAALLADLTAGGALTLAEARDAAEAGTYPLLLDVLQRLAEIQGIDTLKENLAQEKVNIVSYVCSGVSGGERAQGVEGAEGEGVAATRAAAGQALAARGLTALAPQLALHRELARQLALEAAPAALYRWLKAQVPASERATGHFVATLVGAIAEHVTCAANTAAAGGVGATAAAAREGVEREAALAETFAPLLTALVGRDAQLQLSAVYAVHTHAHHHRYPRGMLLRWFMYLYNLEVCEEEAFLRWREDVTPHYPAKGEALFQVNTWLTWLQQQESEDEDEAED